MLLVLSVTHGLCMRCALWATACVFVAFYVLCVVCLFVCVARCLCLHRVPLRVCVYDESCWSCALCVCCLGVCVVLRVSCLCVWVGLCVGMCIVVRQRSIDKRNS